MSDNEKRLYVTRREFYVALMLVWLYMMIVIGDLMRLEGQAGSQMILWAGSLFMTFVCFVMSFRIRPESRAGIARDDAIKVEPSG